MKLYFSHALPDVEAIVQSKACKVRDTSTESLARQPRDVLLLASWEKMSAEDMWYQFERMFCDCLYSSFLSLEEAKCPRTSHLVVQTLPHTWHKEEPLECVCVSCSKLWAHPISRRTGLHLQFTGFMRSLDNWPSYRYHHNGVEATEFSTLPNAVPSNLDHL